EASQLKLLQDIARAVGVTPSVSAVTVGQAYMLRRASRPRGRAWQLERNLLRPFVLRFWRRPVAGLTHAAWREHAAKRRRERTRTGRPPCELTINLELAAAKRIVPALRACKPARARTRRESWFTAEQVDQLVAAASALRWRYQQQAFAGLAAVMGDTGLRISEALGLRWDRITLRGVTSVVGKGSKARIVALTP